MSRGFFYRTVLKRVRYASEGQATVDVFVAGTLVRPQLWTEQVGGVSVPNPFTVGPTGIAAFWVEDGSYDVTFTGADTQSLFSVPIFDYAGTAAHEADCNLHSCDGILRLEAVINNTQTIEERAISLDATTAQGAVVTVNQGAIWKSL